MWDSGVLKFFASEIGLAVFVFGMMIADLVVKDDDGKGRALAQAGMIGAAALLGAVVLGWGNFGEALKASFTNDALASFFKGYFIIAAFIALFMAKVYQKKLKRGHGELTLLILIALAGMLFLASASDFILFFVALETLTVSLYVMTAYLSDEERSIEAGVKYLILGALSTAVFLYGLSFIYGSAGSTNYFQIQLRLSEMAAVPPSFVFGMVLVVASLCFKIAAVPFQMWAPDVYEGAPTPVTAFLSIGSKAAGFAALIRLSVTVFSSCDAKLALLFSILAALTIFYGNLGAIGQTNIKRMLGYSSIGHAGYLLIGLATPQTAGKEAMLVYLASYIVSTGSVFVSLVIAGQWTRSDDISELAGLSKRSPLLAAGMMLGLLSLAGVPPLAGFFGKFDLLLSAARSGLYWLVFIGVFNVITSLYYYLRVVKVMYVDKPKENLPYRVPGSQKAMQYLLIAGILFLGVYPGPVVRLAALVFGR